MPTLTSSYRLPLMMVFDPNPIWAKTVVVSLYLCRPPPQTTPLSREPITLHAGSSLQLLVWPLTFSASIRQRPWLDWLHPFWLVRIRWCASANFQKLRARTGIFTKSSSSSIVCVHREGYLQLIMRRWMRYCNDIDIVVGHRTVETVKWSDLCMKPANHASSILFIGHEKVLKLCGDLSLATNACQEPN